MTKESDPKVTKEDLNKLILFLENDFFSIYRKAHWCFMVVMLVAIFTLVGKRYIPYALAHVAICLTIAFLLARIHIKKRAFLILRNAQEYIPVAELQSRWLARTKSLKQSLSMEWYLPLKYFHSRSSVYWRKGEAIYSLGFFVLYAIPVIVPMFVVRRQFSILLRDGYLVLYPLLLLFVTYAFFWLSNFYLWRKIRQNLLRQLVGVPCKSYMERKL